MNRYKTLSRQSGFFGIGFGLGLIAIFGTTSLAIDTSSETDNQDQAVLCENVMQDKTTETTECTQLMASDQSGI